MEELKIQIKCCLVKNKIYTIMLLAYVAVMISLMANMQAEVPFNNVQNFFNNNHVIINILMFQAILITVGFFRYKGVYMIGEGVSRKFGYIGNVINSIIFSIVSSILIVVVFCSTIAVRGSKVAIRRGVDIYYFGLEIYAINFDSIIKMIIYTFAACMVIMAICNILAMIPKLWSYLWTGLLIVVFVFNIWQKNLVVSKVSKFFRWYKAPYYLGITLALLAIVLFGVGWFLVRRISLGKFDKPEENYA